MRAARNAVILVAIQDRQAIKLAEFVEFLGLDHVADQFRGDEFGHAFLVVGGVEPHRLVLLRGARLAFSFDDAKDLPRHQPCVADTQRRARDHELRERGRRPHHLLGERADLALQLLHPVARQLGAVAFRIPKRTRTDVGHADVGLAAITVERAQDRIVSPLAADEPVGRVGVTRALDAHDPETGSGVKDDFARLRVVRTTNVLNIDFPAQVSRTNHGDAQPCP